MLKQKQTWTSLDQITTPQHINDEVKDVVKVVLDKDMYEDVSVNDEFVVEYVVVENAEMTK